MLSKSSKTDEVPLLDDCGVAYADGYQPATDTEVCRLMKKLLPVRLLSADKHAISLMGLAKCCSTVLNQC